MSGLPALRQARTAALLAVGLLFNITCAQAQSVNIGKAPVVRNDVRGALASGTVSLHAGDSVFRDEGMRTGDDSEAKLVFLDNTNLVLSPNASVRLDTFVYSGDRGAQAIGMNLTKGVFRFVTGKADKSAYRINTPVATIGVRGTQLDIVVIRGRTSVTLLEGEAIVCPRRKPQDRRRGCVVLNHPYEQAVVTADGTTSKGIGQPPFQAYCGAAAGLCVASSYDSNLQYAGTGALCGR